MPLIDIESGGKEIMLEIWIIKQQYSLWAFRGICIQKEIGKNHTVKYAKPCMMATMFSYVPHVSVCPISFCKVALFPSEHTTSGYYRLFRRLQTLHNARICSANFLEIWLIWEFKIVGRQQVAFFFNLHLKLCAQEIFCKFVYHCI